MVPESRSEDHDQDARRHDQRQRRILSQGGESDKALRLAITTDWLTSFGGAERVLEELRTLFPAAPIYTSVFDPSRLPFEMRSWPVRTTFLQRLPVPTKYSRGLLPLMPAAFSRLDLENFDTVLTVSSAFSKNVRARADLRHVCYCLTPPRYLWDLHEEYLRLKLARVMAAPVAGWLRDKDLRAAKGVDEFVAISKTVAARIQATYGRPSAVIYPPVNTTRFARTIPRSEGYFLVVSRLIRYKRIDLAVAACTRLGRRLVVAGTGPLRSELERAAGPTVTFLGLRSDDEITALMAGCDAFLFPGLEDFGIAPVEAQAAGRPVIAYGRGGATETVLEGVTGVFFDHQTVESLVEAIERFDGQKFEPSVCRQNAQRFDASVFRSEMVRLIAPGR